MINTNMMSVVTPNEAKRIMLDIMDDIDALCCRYNLRYYLAFGTLLGAIRHKGFIPWDDDIDIMMPRPDYELFIRYYQIGGKYSIHTPNDRHPLFYYSKVYDLRTVKIEAGISYRNRDPLGIDVDIFPLDGCPSSFIKNGLVKQRSILNHIYLFRYYSIDDVSFSKNRSNPFLGFLLGVFSHFVGNRLLMRMYKRVVTRNAYDCSDIVAEFGLRDNLFRKKDLETIIRVPFEDRFYNAPLGYDSVLRSSYGDYMVIPPSEKQKSHHTNSVFWRD